MRLPNADAGPTSTFAGRSSWFVGAGVAASRRCLAVLARLPADFCAHEAPRFVDEEVHRARAPPADVFKNQRRAGFAGAQDDLVGALALGEDEARSSALDDLQ